MQVILKSKLHNKAIWMTLLLFNEGAKKKQNKKTKKE